MVYCDSTYLDVLWYTVIARYLDVLWYTVISIYLDVLWYTVITYIWMCYGIL